MPPIVNPFAQINASLPPLVPNPADLAPPPINIPDDGTALQKIPQTQTGTKVFHPVTPQEREGQMLSSRLEGDYQKDLQPWGTPENHPGVWGKIGHAISVATGGPNRRLMEEAGLENRVNSLTTQEQENELRAAQAGEAGARTGLTEEQTQEAPKKAESEEKLQEAQAENQTAEAGARQQPDLAHAYAHAVSAAMAGGRDPMQDPVVQHLADAITQIQRQPQAKEPNAVEGLRQKLVQAEGAGDQKQVATLKKQIEDMNPAAEQRLGIEINNRDNKQDVSTRQASFKAYQPAMDSAERFNVMAKNYEDAVKNHDQQAMLSLLANHLGMTMGLQKGARMTKDIIHEAQESRPWLQGMEAKFDKNGYLSGVTLSPEQMRQMVDLGRERFSEDITKAGNEAKYLGASDNGPDRTPNKSVINHYLGMANGDVNKAKQLATQDGWTVK